MTRLRLVNTANAASRERCQPRTLPAANASGRSLALAAGIVIALTFAGFVHAEPPLPAPLRGVGFDQRVNEQVPLDLAFHDEAGREIHLADYFHGKPVILILAWYRCPMLCTEVLNGVTRAMLDMSLTAGKDFQVVTVSFDPHEGPELAASKKKTYLERYGRVGADAGWHFLTGDEPSIKRLANAVGFRYTYDEYNQQFSHASGIMVLTPTGKLYRYFLDIKYPARDLELSLVQASHNKIGTVIDQALLFCFHYDPSIGKYGPAVMNLVRLGGVLTVLGIGIMVLLLRRNDRLAPSPLAGKGWGGGSEPPNSSPPTPTLPRKGGRSNAVKE